MSTLVLDAVLLDAGVTVPRRGFLHSIGLMRYRVERVLSGVCDAELILVGHSGADVAQPDFQPGARHRLTLTRSFPPGASVVTTFARDDLDAYYCEAYELIGDG